MAKEMTVTVIYFYFKNIDQKAWMYEPLCSKYYRKKIKNCS